MQNQIGDPNFHVVPRVAMKAIKVKKNNDYKNYESTYINLNEINEGISRMKCL